MTKLPPLIELRAFDAVARHLSFKKAAAELGGTPTAVSHQIRLLERYCGRSLFRRRPGRYRLPARENGCFLPYVKVLRHLLLASLRLSGLVSNSSCGLRRPMRLPV